MEPNTAVDTDSNPNPTPLEVYVDGSYKGGRVLFGFMVVENNQCIHKERGELQGEVTKMHQIGGELKAVLSALSWAKKEQRPITICYDYLGIEMWVADLFGKRPWETKNKWTEGYRSFLINNQQWLVGMKKVKAHSGHFWNTKIDEFVGETCGWGER
jgi:ribonuclease HI